MKEEYTHGYDSREYFVRELMIRVHNFLEGNSQEPKRWFETLRDYYSFISPALDDRVKYQNKIMMIKNKIYGKVKNGLKLTGTERQVSLNQAYEDIRDLFEEMHIEVYKKEWYVPIIKPRNPKRATAGYYD